MTTTRADFAARAQQRQAQARLERTASRNLELLLLVFGSILVVTGLWLVYSAKTYIVPDQPLLDLNSLSGPQALIPLLKMVPSAADQEFIANRIYDAKRRGEKFENTGALARLRVTASEIQRSPGLDSFAKRMADARERREGRESNSGWFARLFRRSRAEREISVPLLTPQQFAQLKPNVIVRELGRFRKSFWIWTALFFLAFYAVHALWRLRGFSGDNLLLPTMHVLCGVGLMLMLSLRDPLRDTLMFTDFTQGVIAGCAALFLFSLPDYERSFSRLSYVPLIASFLLAIALGMFGSGPGTSDAKVNLFFFQPVEVIRILIVLFLAGYFAQSWDALRQLRQEGGTLARFSQRWNTPRLDYALPVAIGVVASLLLFFWLSDLGPALVLGCLFLSMYAIARKRAPLAAAGLGVIVLGFIIGHAIGYPRTAADRVDMWLSPWNNYVHGGDQIADSLWALSTGGETGTGLGLGDAQIVPAGHTDLIVSALGEETGFLGVLAVYLLYGVLLYRGLRIAVRAQGAYSFFLAAGLTLALALQILLISGGLLDLIPLSGVVSPFLSYGRTSMVANFALFGMILAISSRAGKRDQEENFGQPARATMALLGALFAIVLARFGYVQIAKADDIVAKGALVTQADGVRRYQYNPRLIDIARTVPKGTIYDRNGLPLATSDAATLDRHRADYQRLGINIDPAAKLDHRVYPLGPPMFYMLGDVRSRLKQGASNTAFQEKASRIRLQGYDDVVEVEEVHDPKTGQTVARLTHDYRALIPMLRHRYEPDNPQVKELLNRPRDVRMSIDSGLQLRVSQILKDHLTKLGKEKGAVVVMDPSNGDLLASVSYPWPTDSQFTALSANPETPMPDADLIDRARFGLFPPGSSFKVVTALAALRKDPALVQQRFECIRLPDGRVGNFVGKRAIRDDITDREPHGSVDMAKGITVSCNAYFAQLGAEKVGADALYQTATALGISVAQPDTPAQLKQFLAQASYGQGQVVVSPFQMARVAATVANGGNAPQGRWVIDETNSRVRPMEPVVTRDLATEIAGFMRSVVTSGTGHVLGKSSIPIAGKTGTAELGKAPSHAWFIGFAPYGGKSGKQIAFAVLVENGQYGGTAAAPIAGEIVEAAHQLGII